jgi:phosphoribosyl 1,2-cyclic phosphodiesterase
MLIAAAGSKVVFIEANYDEDMLSSGPYPYFLKKRISSDKGHLSNSDCARAIISLAQNGSCNFVLSHLSRDNNMPYIALQTIRNSLNEHSGMLSEAIQLSVAHRYATSDPIILSR